MRKTEKVEELFKLGRSCSLSRLQSYAGQSSLTLTEIEPSQAVFGHWMSLILIVNPLFRVTFKAHFHSGAITGLAAQVYGKKPGEIEVSQSLEFAKEYCNLVAGRIKGALSPSIPETGISLPMVLRGFDQVFFPLSDEENVFERFWKLQGQGVDVICSALIEISDEARFGAWRAEGLEEQEDAAIDLF